MFKPLKRIILSIFMCASLFISTYDLKAQPGGEGIVIGKIFQLKSNVFNEERGILVYTPTGYKDSNQKYPVLYLLDGYDHFHYVSGMVLALSRYGKIPQMIVVGIQNPHRNRDFTPKPVKDLPNSGGGDKFLQFAEKELFPFIEKNYRTETCRVLMGHSLCGMFSIYTLLKETDMFKGIIAVSPATNIDDSYLLKYTSEKLTNGIDSNNKLYFTVGGKELKSNVESIKELETILNTDKPEGLDWNFKQYDEEGHHSVVYMSIFDGLQFIFKDMIIPEEISNGDADEIIDYYENISEMYGYQIPVPENTLNAAGYKHLREGDLYDAIEAFMKNVELYPNSANALNSLGEAYEANNQPDLAFEYYKKAYELGIKTRDPNLFYFMQDYESIQKKIKNR